MTSSISWGFRMPFQVIIPDFGTPVLITVRIWSSVREAQNFASRKSRDGLPAAVSFFPPEPSALWQITQFFVKTALPRTGSPGLTAASAGRANKAMRIRASRVRVIGLLEGVAGSVFKVTAFSSPRQGAPARARAVDSRAFPVLDCVVAAA